MMKTGVGRDCKVTNNNTCEVDKAHRMSQRRNTELAGQGNEKQPTGKQINLKSA